MKRFYMQSPPQCPIPMPCLAQVCQQLDDQGWTVDHVVPVGVVTRSKVLDIKTNMPQGMVPAFAVVIHKELEPNQEKPAFPDINVRW